MNSCNSVNNVIEFQSTIDLGKSTPIGMANMDGHVWVSDGDNNMLLHIDQNGQYINVYEDFDRPMHLSANDGKVYVPEYGKDQITILEPDSRSALMLSESLDAPASIDVTSRYIGIADFYNHRVLFFNGLDWVQVGAKGHNKGELYYPTDVQVLKDRIFVADAYNNRVQVYTHEGQHLLTIAEDDKLNAATGLYVTQMHLYVTDFENDRVLIYSHQGSLIQVLDENLSKPTDVLQVGNEIWISNYGSKSINRYAQYRIE